jgi:signal transduction histidine kinase
VQGLRASAVIGSDLTEAIKTLIEELASDQVAFRVSVQGTPRSLRPIAHDEIYHIAAEALSNSRRHAQASEIEVELSYDDHQFRLRVRDNGKGIETQFLNEESTQGHYGLHGMRERTKLLGGQLNIRSAPASGTEIELTVPAARAYGPTHSKILGRFWG